MNIIIYSTSTCPYCKMLKDYLQQHKFEFVEKMVDANNEAKDEMANLSDGFLGVPFTVIKKDDGTLEKVIGFDRGRLAKILGIES